MKTNLLINSLFILLTVVAVSFADEEIDKRLTAEQLTLQADIEHSLVSPCCWNMTVDLHESGASRKVRLKIADLIQAGKSKADILAHFVAQPQYGERILATPAQDTLLGKSAYWLIPIAILFGVLLLIKTVKRLLKPQVASKNKQHRNNNQKTSASTDNDPNYSGRIEEDLNELEA